MSVLPSVPRRMLIPVYFRSTGGGLHAHVEDQLVFAREAGFEPVVVCPSGAWAASVSGRAPLVTSDFADLEQLAQDVCAFGPFALIHAHPGRARQLAQLVRAQQPTPLVVTYHGPREESLTAASPDIDLAVAVSDFTRRYILRKSDASPGKVLVIPNAVDNATFASTPDKSSNDRPMVVIVSRLDADKEFVVSVIEECLEIAGRDPAWEGVDWRICGGGTESDRIARSCQQLNDALGRESAMMLGWLSPGEIADVMRQAHAVLAPGRSALEAMAVGAPTVALGSKGYVGFLEGSALLAGLDCNFGGGGIGRGRYRPGQASADLQRAMGREGDPQLSAAYAAVAASRSMSSVATQHAFAWTLATAVFNDRASESRPSSVRARTKKIQVAEGSTP